MRIVLRKTEKGLRAFIDGVEKTTPFNSLQDFQEFFGCMMHFGIYPRTAQLAYDNGMYETEVTPTYESEIRSRPMILF